MLKSFLNWKVWLNILITLGIFSGLVWGTFRWLDHHTNHGQEIPVPNVVNMQVHQAVKELENMGLTVEVDSFKYDPKYKPFQVLQVFPSAGSRVKNGRTVVLRVNPKTWAKVEVPDLIERYKGLAYSRLELLGLKVGDTIYEASIQKDAVLKMLYKGDELKPGTLLPKFTVIDLVIGAGPMRDITVPNVIGFTVKEAKEIIKANNFEVGLVDFEDSDKDENDIVYYQDPALGSLRDQGMQIDIWASKKTPAEMLEKVKELDKIYKLPEEEDIPSELNTEKDRKANTPISYPKPKPKQEKVNTEEPIKEKTSTEIKEETPKSKNVIVE